MDDSAGLYDDATARRIEARRIDAAPRRVVRAAPRPARALGAGALLTAVALGLQEVFDPRDGDEVILEVDLAGEPLDDQAVILEYDPWSASRSRAHVRPWLLAGA